MDFKQLEAFVQVAKLGSFSGAAKSLYLTQPTISTHISSLEEELGVKLVLRTTKEVSLSSAGSIFYEYAEDILNRRSNAINAIEVFSSQVKGKLKISTSSIPGIYCLPAIMADFIKIYPEVSFSVLSCDSACAINYLKEKEVEIAFTGTKPDSASIVSYSFCKDKLVLATPNTHTYRILISQNNTDALMQKPFIIREKGSGTQHEADIFLKSLDINLSALNVVAEFGDNESIKRAIKEGMGVSVISAQAVEDLRASKELLVFEPENSWERDLYVSFYEDRPISQTAKIFMDFAKNYFNSVSE